MSKVLIGVTGGIAAYKVCEVTSTLAKSDVEVRVLMTPEAEQFVSPLTFAALSRNAVSTDADFWSRQQGRPLHIELGEWADAFLIAPLTANTLGKLAHGLADNLLTNTVLASTCPILLAPAMNTDMWEQTSVQANLQTVMNAGSGLVSAQDDGVAVESSAGRYHLANPGSGRLACDRVGTGRMAEPSHLVNHLHSLLHTQGHQDLTGKHLLISTGSTQEYIDPVRFIGNPATGRMGIALAQAALHRGADVTLVHGPLSSDIAATVPGAVTSHPITTAAQMASAMLQYLPDADWVIMAAAVADMRPTTRATHKLPKAQLPNPLPLEPVPDIVQQLSQKRQPHQRIVGFAAQTGDILAPAKAKLERKQLDAIVANPIDQSGSGFGSETNTAQLIFPGGRVSAIALTSKHLLAHHIYDQLLQAM